MNLASKLFLFFPLLGVLVGTVSAATPQRNPIVVELFTSEGCSSCPPADAILSKLRAEGTVEGSEILVLGEHVDYWNNLGWADRFSSAALTKRQADYANRFDLNSSYTPQMVIDGHAELVGNGERAILVKTARITQLVDVFAGGPQAELMSLLDRIGSGSIER